MGQYRLHTNPGLTPTNNAALIVLSSNPSSSSLITSHLILNSLGVLVPCIGVKQYITCISFSRLKLLKHLLNSLSKNTPSAGLKPAATVASPTFVALQKPEPSDWISFNPSSSPNAELSS